MIVINGGCRCNFQGFQGHWSGQSSSYARTFWYRQIATGWRIVSMCATGSFSVSVLLYIVCTWLMGKASYSMWWLGVIPVVINQTVHHIFNIVSCFNHCIVLVYSSCLITLYVGWTMNDVLMWRWRITSTTLVRLHYSTFSLDWILLIKLTINPIWQRKELLLHQILKLFVLTTMHRQYKQLSVGNFVSHTIFYCSWFLT